MTNKERVEAILELLEIPGLPYTDLDNDRTSGAVLNDLCRALDDWRMP